MRVVRPNRSQVVYDIIDGQVLVIRSDTGAYYSLDDTAAEAWAVIMATGDEGAVVAELQRRYPDAADVVPAEVAALVDRLLEEQLIEAGPLPADAAEHADVPSGPVWTTPQLEAFNDMKDLLLFDPIHEVGPEGWPQAANDRG